MLATAPSWSPPASGQAGDSPPPAAPPGPPVLDGTLPSALRTLNVDTPVAAAISRRVLPAASSAAIRATVSGVSLEACFGLRRAGTSPATPAEASA